jgi:hypothetical protein
MFVFLQFFHSAVDRIRRVFHATLQVDLVRASNNATSKRSLQSLVSFVAMM